MAEAIGSCPHCGQEFENKRERYTHLEKWGCKAMYDALTVMAAPKCKCGCGQKVEEAKRKPGTFNEFVRGHNKRSAKQGE